jgi:hypothetical protein
LPAAVLAMATVGISPAAAQPAKAPAKPPAKRLMKPPRVEISANVGALTAGSAFTESESFPSNVETATVTTDHGTKTAVSFNVGGAVRIVPQFWVGVQYAMAQMKPNASVTALIPHPLLFNAPRTVQGSLNNVTHDERNVHVEAMYVLPVRALEVTAMAGPTFFNLQQDFVPSIAVTETYPFDTATFASATTKRLTKGAVGFNAGVDVSRPLSRRVSVGALVRYSRASVKFSSGNTLDQTVKAGGLEAGGGIRVRF